jgi:hypothetical protein
VVRRRRGRGRSGERKWPAHRGCVPPARRHARVPMGVASCAPLPWRLASGSLLLTPYFAKEIYPFLEVFSGWYLSKKILNHPFSGMHGCQGCVCLWREGYTSCIDATFLPAMDDHPWPCVVHRSVRETVERIRCFQAILGGRCRGGKEEPLPPRQASRHGSARRDARHPNQHWRAVVSGAPDM